MSDIVERLRNWNSELLYRLHNDAADEVERLRKLLREARQYVSDAGNDDDPETTRNAAELLSEIDKAVRP